MGFGAPSAGKSREATSRQRGAREMFPVIGAVTAKLEGGESGSPLFEYLDSGQFLAFHEFEERAATR